MRRWWKNGSGQQHSHSHLCLYPVRRNLLFGLLCRAVLSAILTHCLPIIVTGKPLHDKVEAHLLKTLDLEFKITVMKNFVTYCDSMFSYDPF